MKGGGRVIIRTLICELTRTVLTVATFLPSLSLSAVSPTHTVLSAQTLPTIIIMFNTLWGVNM